MLVGGAKPGGRGEVWGRGEAWGRGHVLGLHVPECPAAGIPNPSGDATRP